jgi:uncharacterized cupin superfamily protein
MYISASEIAAMEGTRKVHFLNPAAVRIDKSIGDAVGLRHIGVHMIMVEPGHHSTEYHSHRVEEECIFVLSGRGIAVLGENLQTIGPGDFIGCPANGIAHELINDGTEPLQCLVMGERMSQDDVDFPRLNKRLYRRHDQLELADTTDIETILR